MRHYILTGHAHISEGIASAIKFVLGIEIPYFNAYIENEGVYSEKILAQIQKYSQEDDVIIMTDIMGGSVNNDMMAVMNLPNVHLVCGMNLALVVQMVLSDQEQDTKELIKQSIQMAKEGIQYCNEIEVSDSALDEF